jgi:hypothetical protein
VILTQEGFAINCSYVDSILFLALQVAQAWDASDGDPQLSTHH